MGTPNKCSCGIESGLLAVECRSCGEDIRLAGVRGAPLPPLAPGDGFRLVRSGTFHTEYIPDTWRATDAEERGDTSLDVHSFLGYCLLLRAMQLHFDEEDKVNWFDANIFFVRGGYEFWSHLNTASRMGGRAEVFGGLRHAKRPGAEFREWLQELVAVAQARKQSIVDIFVADEITSGTGINRILNVTDDVARMIGDQLERPLELRFRFFVASTPARKFDHADYSKGLDRKGRRAYIRGAITVRNTFRWFHGPLLAYDNEDIGGVRLDSSSADAVEHYGIVKYTATSFALRCPSMSVDVHMSGPGQNDIPNLIGVTISELIGPLRHSSPLPGLLGHTIRRLGCDECVRLYGALTAPSIPWPSQPL